MKILITNTYYFPAFVGGAEISVKLLAEGLTAAGHEVYVLTTGLQNRVYKVNNVIVISVKQRNLFNSYDKTQRSKLVKTFWHLLDSLNFLYYFKIAAILKRLGPDIAHTNNVQGFSPFLWYIIKRQKIPLVHSMRDYYMLCHKCSLYNGENCKTLCTPCKTTHSVKKYFFKFPDHFIGISKFILNKHQFYHSAISDKISLIYNAVDTSQSALTINAPRERIVFGYIGRIDLDKGVGYMVEELANLAPDEKNKFKVVFAGQGPSKLIEELSSQLEGIEFEFLGLTKQADFYRAIDLLIVPALWNEPFGRIVIESLSYMVPVCQSDRGGLKEIYSSDSSWIFSPYPGHLTKKLSHILNHTDQLAEKKLNCVNEIDKFSVEKYISKHLTLYQEITSGEASKLTENIAATVA
jgi:glycosyltransferase involved in cell wall biosynthesis